jgi:hypothetical protein
LLTWVRKAVARRAITHPFDKAERMGHPDLWRHGKQIPPLRYGMTTKRMGTAKAGRGFISVGKSDRL